MVQHLKNWIFNRFFNIPNGNRWFSGRFLAVNFISIILVILYAIIVGIIPLWLDRLLTNLFILVWFLIALRYIVQAIRMRKILDTAGVVFITLFMFLLLFILGQGG